MGFSKTITITIYLLILFFLFSLGCAQPEPPCGLDYGTSEDRRAIQFTMLEGSQLDVEIAINKAKDTRGLAVGCPQIAYGPFYIADTTEPNIEEIKQVWKEGYVPKISAYQIGCPELGRGMPSVGLGAFYAKIGGYFDDLTSLEMIAQMLLATQYSSANASEPFIAPPGLYGYYFSEENNDPCTLTGVAGNATQSFCTLVPERCIQYDKGLFQGMKFSVNDHVWEAGEPIGDIGGAGYDQGWAGVFMVESAIQQQNSPLRDEFRASALMAGEWAITHPIVTNHNYTSKLIWLLAELYNWTGRGDFKDALIDKLDRNLVPGVLMDLDNDGLVDGMTDSIPFANLTDIATIPGRNRDGHNALPWYHSMNAWAMLEAYVAFRDRGDMDLANKYRPYVIAMLDNLAYEIVHLGIPENTGAGSRDVPFSLLLGLWKLSQYEQENHPLWEQAVWAIWNSGIFTSSLGEKGLNIPLYLLIKEKVPYVPLHIRDPFVLDKNENTLENALNIYPNPAWEQVTVELPTNYQKGELLIYDIKGKLLKKVKIGNEDKFILSLLEFPKGLLMFQYLSGDKIFVQKVVKED